MRLNQLIQQLCIFGLAAITLPDSDIIIERKVGYHAARFLHQQNAAAMSTPSSLFPKTIQSTAAR